MSAELALIQKVELRIALATTPEAFQRAFDTYLPPLLLKFASPNPQVKSQIMSTTKFLLSKFNTTPTLKVPINALLEQVKLPNVSSGSDSSSVQNYSLLFISKGIDRLDGDQKLDLFSKIWDSISTFSPSVTARLFNIGLKLLVSFDSIVPPLPEFTNADDSKFIFQKFYKFMLLHPTKLTENGQIDNSTFQKGLSLADVSFFYYQAGAIFNSHLLSTYKLKLLKFLDPIESSDKTLALVCACADSDSEVSSVAITALKRVSINYESHQLIQTLIDMFIGNGIPPVRSQLQERIILILCKSEYAAKSSYVDQIAIIGMDSPNNKVKQGTVSFIRWFTTIVATSDLDDFDDGLAINICEKLKFSLSSTDNHPQNFKLYLTQRQIQYETLGLLLKKVPNLVTLPYVNFFFHMITVEDISLKISIQVVLAGLGPELKSFHNSDKEKLYDLLQNTIKDSSSEPIAKLVSIKLLNSVYDFENPDCRLLNILALKGVSTKDNVTLVEEVNKGLHPYWFRVLNEEKSISFPNFSQLISKMGDIFDTYDALCIKVAIKFAWNCLVMNAIGENQRASQIIGMDQYWQTKLDNAIEYDDIIHKCLVDYVNNFTKIDSQGDTDMNGGFSDNSIGKFLSILFIAASKSEFNLEILKNIHKILSIANDDTISSVANDNNVNKFLDSSLSLYTDESIYYTSTIIGVLSTHPNIKNDAISKLILILTAQQTPIYNTIWGFVISRLEIRGRLDSILTPDSIISHLTKISHSLDSTSSRDIKSALDVVTQLSMFNCLSLNDPKLIKLKEEMKFKIKKLVLRQNEAATTCWAYFSLSFDQSVSSDGELNEFESTLYQTYDTKHPDFLFTVGECWTILASGWKSKVMKNMNDVRSAVSPNKNPNRVKIIFETIMRACFNNKPSIRKAGCIWLLSMVQFSYDTVMTEKVKDIQHAFMRFLSDKEEIIQEAASRGLSIIYENGDSGLQDVLVHDLLLSFTDSDKTTKEIISEYVDQDTQLFDQGVMSTGDGKSVNTYKDVLSLASEIGDPSLVYKFMSLAKNSALWSSRKGIAFGLGTILDKSKLTLMMDSNTVMAKRLIIKLWRYKHDPNPDVSRAMNNIWDSLIVDPKKVIEENFDILYKECITGMGSMEWRSREASTIALHELLNQVEFTKFDSNLKEIWTMSFRAMDDIKASVRKEGEKLTRFLANSMISKISSSSGNNEVQSTILEQLIPFLLGNGGLLSDIEEVKKFAFETVMKLINTNSKSLKPYVTEMVTQMVSMMSSVEPQFINYIALNADKYNLEANDIDSQRLGMIGSSPLMTAIEKLLGLLDNENISRFIEDFNICAKNAIGLPSKVAASKVIVDLIVRHLFLVKDYGDRLLKMASSQLKDRNDTVARSYAMACGYVVRCSSIKSTQSLSKRLVKYYFEKKAETGEDRFPLISAYTSECVFKFSNDKFQSIASAFLPLAFIGKHDPNEQISTNFKKVWVDTTNSSSSAIKLYFGEILDLMNKNIDSTNLELRKTIAFSIIELVNKLGNDISTIDESQLLQLYEILLGSLKGRTYDGKEKLLQSLVLLAKNSKSYLVKNQEIFNEVVNRIVNEVKRKNDAYRKQCIMSFGLFLSSYPEDEWLYQEYIREIDSLLKERDGDVDMDDKDTTKIGIEYTLFNQMLINNIISSVSVENINYNTLEYSIDVLLSHIRDINIDMIKSKDGKHKYKLGILNLLRRLIFTVFGDSDNETRVSKSLQSEYKLKILEIWRLIGTVVITVNELQSIIIPFIRLTRMIMDNGHLTGPEMKECTSALVNIKVNINNTVVIKEVNNALPHVA